VLPKVRLTVVSRETPCGEDFLDRISRELTPAERNRDERRRRLPMPRPPLQQLLVGPVIGELGILRMIA
jgi:hypothetical protein